MLAQQAAGMLCSIGINRHVWLIQTNAIHIAHWGTFITTPHVNTSSATVNIRTEVQNETSVSSTITFVNKNNKSKNGERSCNFRIDIKNKT